MIRKLGVFQVYLAVATIALLSGCNEFLGNQRIVFMGYVIDGSTGQRLTDYSMTFESGDAEFDVSVEGDGRFVTDEANGRSAYVVTVNATGYRPFQALQNAEFTGSVPAQVLLREVVLFPENLTSPAVQLDIIDGEEQQFALSGAVRLVPDISSGVSDFDVGDELGGATRWANDLDQTSQVFSLEFTNSSVVVAEGALTFGVRYRVDVFNVPTYQTQIGAAFIRGGTDIGRVIDLASLADAAPVLLTASDDFCQSLPSLASLPGFTTIIRFEYNDQVEFVDEERDRDDLVVAPSVIGPGVVTGDPEADDEQVVINGNVVELQWNPSATFDDFDPNTDDFDSVSFSGINGVQIRRVGSVGSATGLPVFSFTCQNEN